MRVLVTGGAGAIGSHLVARLLADGHQVAVLDDLSSGHAHLVPSTARFVRGSVADPAAVEEGFATRPDVVAHLAALFANQNSVDHPILDLEVNGTGTLRILDACERYGVGRVLVCSSSCVYGSVPIAEEGSPAGSSQTPYAITKGLAESYAAYYAQRGLHTVVVRPFNVYGPHEYPGEYRNVIPNFLAASLRREPLLVTGTGRETRDFTFVADAVDGMARALLGPTRPGDTFNIGSGRAVEIGELATLINAITGSDGGIEHVGRRAWDGTPHRLASIERARQQLGYVPATSLETGLELTRDWLANATWPIASS